MKRYYLAASIAAIVGAVNFDLELPDVLDSKPELKIVYPDGIDIDDVRVSRDLYPMVFRWPELYPRCGGTMISPQVALTSAGCVYGGEESSNTLQQDGYTVELTDGDGNLTEYAIVDIRVHDCYWS